MSEVRLKYYNRVKVPPTSLCHNGKIQEQYVCLCLCVHFLLGNSLQIRFAPHLFSWRTSLIDDLLSFVRRILFINILVLEDVIGSDVGGRFLLAYTVRVRILICATRQTPCRKEFPETSIVNVLSCNMTHRPGYLTSTFVLYVCTTVYVCVPDFSERIKRVL